MLGEALAYPRNDDSWLKTVGIGGLLVLGGAIIFVPIFPVYGYLLQTVRAGALKQRQPPRFEDWERLFVDGAKMFAVMFILVGLPAFVFLIFLLISVGVGLMSMSGGGGALGAVGIVLGVLTLALFLVIMFTGYVFPVALVRLALEGDFSAAFDFGTMKRVAFSWDFFVAWLVALAIGMTLGLVAAILTFLLVGVFLSFFVQVVVFYILGWGVGESLDLDPGDYPPGPGAAPTGSGQGGHGGPGSRPAHEGQPGGRQAGRGGHQQGNRGQGGYDQQRGGYDQHQGGYDQQQGRQGNRRGGHEDQHGGRDGTQQGGRGRSERETGDDQHRGGEQPPEDRYSEDYRQFEDDSDEDDRRQ